MSAARTVIIVVAFVAAIGLAVVVRGILVGRPTKAVPLPAAEASVPAIPMVRVLVAKKDLPVGTRIGADDMTWQSMPKNGLNPAYITDGQVAAPAPVTAKDKIEKGAANAVKTAVNGPPQGMQSLIDAVVHENILAGEPILASKLIRIGEGGYLSAMLQPGMRAVAIPVSAENAAGGFILPGDHVDVIWVHDQSIKGESGKTLKASQVVVTNVRVLAIDQKTKPEGEAQSIVGAAATLEVNPESADALSAAGADGKLQLALRSYADARAASGRVAARSASPASPAVVRLYEDGQVKQVEVTQ